MFKHLVLPLFCMRKKNKLYNYFQPASAIFMIVALLWLTVSTPFVLASQQELAKQSKLRNPTTPLSSPEEETANAFGNTNEEKKPSSNTFSEEYLHDHHTDECFFSAPLRHHHCENADTYTAFH